MTDEPADAGQEAVGPPNDRPLSESPVDRLTNVLSSLRMTSIPWGDLAPLLAVGSIYSKTFVETLAKHHAEALINAVHDHFRRNGKTGELLVGLADGTAAIVVVTEDLPDEARLALLDLDVTAPELRGKELRWDAIAGAWRPSDALPAESNEATWNRLDLVRRTVQLRAA